MFMSSLAWYSQILTKSKGVFHQPLGFKNTILRGSRGRPGEWLHRFRENTAYHLFGPSPPPFTVEALHPELWSDYKQVPALKFLGVIFDQQLSFKPHLNYVCKKVQSCFISLCSCTQTMFDIPSSPQV